MGDKFGHRVLFLTPVCLLPGDYYSVVGYADFSAWSIWGLACLFIVFFIPFLHSPQRVIVAPASNSTTWCTATSACGQFEGVEGKQWPWWNGEIFHPRPQRNHGAPSSTASNPPLGKRPSTTSAILFLLQIKENHKEISTVQYGPNRSTRSTICTFLGLTQRQNRTHNKTIQTNTTHTFLPFAYHHFDTL